MHTFDLERATARDAARLAGQLCLAIRGEMLRSSARLDKAWGEPVTIADYGAQAIVLQQIAQHFPVDGTLAEERAADFDRLTTDVHHRDIVRHVSATLGHSVMLDDIRAWLDHGCDRNSNRIWVVDPIDGTKGFLRGDQFAVAVALVVDGQVMVGALACPLLPYGAGGAAEPRGVVAVAVQGRGAMIEPLMGNGPARPVHVSSRARLPEARGVESVESAHTDHSFSQRVFLAAGVGGQPVRMDSQAKYVAVADGRAEIYLRTGSVHRIWDHAAGVLIVQEAGGHVTDLRGDPLDFSTGPWITPHAGILASNGLVHEPLLAVIKEMG